MQKQSRACACTYACARQFGRAASGGALAPEPPRATRHQPESRIVLKTFFSQKNRLSGCSFRARIKYPGAEIIRVSTTYQQNLPDEHLNLQSRISINHLQTTRRKPKLFKTRFGATFSIFFVCVCVVVGIDGSKYSPALLTTRGTYLWSRNRWGSGQKGSRHSQTPTPALRSPHLVLQSVVNNMV